MYIAYYTYIISSHDMHYTNPNYAKIMISYKDYNSFLISTDLDHKQEKVITFGKIPYLDPNVEKIFCVTRI